MTLTHKEILQLDKYYRIHLINQLSGVKGVHLIGTKSDEGISNLAIFNSVVHIGANPPYMGIIFRPLTVERDTYNNIKSNGHFSINSISEAIYEKAHLTSGKYASEISEFDIVGLTEDYCNDFTAPFVKESPIKIGVSYQEEHLIRANNTLLLIGKVEIIQIDDKLILEDGHIDHTKAATVSVSGLDSYYKNELMSRRPYVRI